MRECSVSHRQRDFYGNSAAEVLQFFPEKKNFVFFVYRSPVREPHHHLCARNVDGGMKLSNQQTIRSGSGQCNLIVTVDNYYHKY